MRQQQDMVRQFHVRNGFSVGITLTVPKSERLKVLLTEASEMMLDYAKQLLELSVDHDGVPDAADRELAMRMHLCVEEPSEMMHAAAEGDEVLMIDAIGDSMYVLLGTGVTFDLPLSEAFDEIHRSNMTKQRQLSDPHGERIRNKGPGYRPPDISGVLKAHRDSCRKKNDGWPGEEVALSVTGEKTIPVKVDEYIVYMDRLQFTRWEAAGKPRVVLSPKQRTVLHLQEQEKRRTEAAK
jgi:hypothetical protein